MPTSSRSTKTAFSTPQVCPQAGSVLLDSSCWATFRCSNPVHSKIAMFMLMRLWKITVTREAEMGENWNIQSAAVCADAGTALWLRSFSWIPFLLMFVLGKCFPSTLNIWMAGCTLWLWTHVSEDWERRRDLYLWLCWNDEKHAGISFCWRDSVSLRNNPKIIHQIPACPPWLLLCRTSGTSRKEPGGTESSRQTRRLLENPHFRPIRAKY